MRVSVIVPVYNAEKTILKCLNSVFQQDFDCPLEIIVVNDGSKDNSKSLIENYISENKINNFFLINKENGGVSTARNVGMKLAKGDWIALLDSDDEWLPKKLSTQFKVISNNPQIDFLGTTRNGEHFKQILWKKFRYLTIIGPKMLLIKFVFVVPTIIFKRNILDDIGYFDETQKYAEEGNFFIRICNKYNCFLLNESLVITGSGKPHFGKSGLSGNLKEMERGELKNLNYAYKLHIINYVEYLSLYTFSIAKYVRRIVIVKIRYLCI